MNEQTEPRPASSRSATWTDVPAHRSIASDDLMGGERVIIIRHGKDEYRLRLTASDKLILTK
jgi:hemin uptake protein HemP